METEEKFNLIEQYSENFKNGFEIYSYAKYNDAVRITEKAMVLADGLKKAIPIILTTQLKNSFNSLLRYSPKKSESQKEKDTYFAYLVKEIRIDLNLIITDVKVFENLTINHGG